MKNKSTAWANIIPTVALGFSLTCCADKSIPVSEKEYSAKIVGRWQGTVGNQQETMSFAKNGIFVCQLQPTGFINTMVFPRAPGRVSGTWSISGSIVNLTIAGERNERFANQVTSSTIVAFTGDKLILEPAPGEISSFQRVGSP